MRPDFAHQLVCPEHRASLSLASDQLEEGRVRSGRLVCSENGCTFQIKQFVPRFVNSDAYADTFSKQRLYVRRHFEDYKKDRSGDRLLEISTGFTPVALRQGRTLEVG